MSTHKQHLEFPALVEIGKLFQLPGVPLEGILYGSGHINDTYRLTYDQGGTKVRYILQKINAIIFKDIPALMDNILRVTTQS